MELKTGDKVVVKHNASFFAGEKGEVIDTAFPVFPHWPVRVMLERQGHWFPFSESELAPSSAP